MVASLSRLDRDAATPRPTLPQRRKPPRPATRPALTKRYLAVIVPSSPLSLKVTFEVTLDVSVCAPASTWTYALSAHLPEVCASADLAVTATSSIAPAWMRIGR